MFGIGQRLGWRVTGTLDISCHGLGCVVNRARIREGISLDYCVVFYFLPIDEERVVVYSYYAMRRKGLLTLPLLRLAMRDGGHTIDQDVPIWENKLFRARPRLSDADGPIMQFRKWAQQFYGSTATESERTAALDEAVGFGDRWSHPELEDHAQEPAPDKRRISADQINASRVRFG